MRADQSPRFTQSETLALFVAGSLLTDFVMLFIDDTNSTLAISIFFAAKLFIAVFLWIACGKFDFNILERIFVTFFALWPTTWVLSALFIFFRGYGQWSGKDHIEQLKDLQSLRERGALTDDEFNEQKALLLNSEREL